MESVIITNVPMKRVDDKLVYRCEGNDSVFVDKEVSYIVSSIVAKKASEGKALKIIFLGKETTEGHTDENIDNIKHEIKALIGESSNSIQFETLMTPFIETADVYGDLLKKIIYSIDSGSEIIADITFGPKSMPIVLFNALKFLEKFKKCRVRNILYGKVNFIEGIPRNPEMVDVTSLYHMNSIFSTLESRNEQEALKILESLLSI